MIRRLFISVLALTVLGTVCLHAQTPVASSGRDFRLALPSLAFGTGGPQWMRINVAVATTTTLTLRFVEYGSSESFTITGGGRWERTIPIDSIMLLQSEHTSDRSLHLTSSEPVTVNVVNDGAFISDGYCALPTESLGFEYIAMSMPGISFTSQANTFGGVIAIVATQDDTEIRITPTVLTEAGNSPGLTYGVTLASGQVYQVRPANPDRTDLSGTRITASKPIAVFSGHRGVATDSISAINSLIEQMVRPSDWGRKFYVMKLAEQSVGRYRVLAQSAGTEVLVDGVRVATLGAGATHDFQSSGTSIVQTSHPVMLVQLGTHRRESSVAIDSDPSMAIVNPTDSYAEAFEWSTPTMPSRVLSDTSIGWRHWAMITAPTAALTSVRLDGSPVGFAFAHGDGLYSTALVSVVPGYHRVTAARPVNVQIFGDSHYDAYAMPAGMRLREPFRAAPVIARTCAAAIDTTITLYNHGADPIEVTSLSFVPGSTSVRRFPDPPFVVTPGGWRTVGIRVSLPTFGRVLDTLTVTTSTSGSRPLRIPIEIWRDSLAAESAERSIDFGSVSPSTPTRDTIIHLVNTGTGPVAITAASFVGPFSLVSPALPVSFSPGDTLALRIRFAPQAPGTVSGRATITLSPCGASVSVDLSGRRLRGAGIDVRHIVVPDVGCVSPDGVDVPVVIRSVGEEPLRFDSIEIRGPGAPAFSVTNPPAGTMIAPGDSLVATLRFAPPAPGIYTISLRVWNNVSPGGYLLTEPFDGRGVFVRPTLSRSSIDFGELIGCAGDSMAAVTIANRGTTAMTVAGLSTATAAYTLMTDPGFVLEPGDSASIVVRFAPQSGGAFADTLTIATTPCDTLLRIALSGTLSSSAVSVGTDTLDLGFVAECALPASGVLSIKNSGRVPIDLSSATIGGTGFSLLEVSDSTLAVGESTSVRVAFTGGPGTHSAMLVVRAEPCGIVEQIPVRVTVTTASIALEGSLDFGRLAPSVATRRSITLRNDGTADIVVDALALTPPITGLTIVEPTPPFPLLAGRDTTIIVEYRSSSPSAFSTMLVVSSTAPCVIDASAAAGGAFDPAPSLALWLPDTSAMIDDQIVIPLRVRRGSETDASATVRLEIRWNRTMLGLDSVTTSLPGTVSIAGESNDGADRVVTIAYAGVVPTAGELVRLHARVLLGNADATPLAIASAEATSGESVWDVSKDDGSLAVLGICYVGGGRFIRINGAFAIEAIAPIPVRENARVTLSSNARSHVVVSLLDALGRHVGITFDGELGAGRHEITLDVDPLPSGLYQIEVRSARHVDRARLVITR